jgi:hypothetical protein
MIRLPSRAPEFPDKSAKKTRTWATVLGALPALLGRNFQYAVAPTTARPDPMLKSAAHPRRKLTEYSPVQIRVESADGADPVVTLFNFPDRKGRHVDDLPGHHAFVRAPS